jgi:hypothetical protein
VKVPESVANAIGRALCSHYNGAELVNLFASAGLRSLALPLNGLRERRQRCQLWLARLNSEVPDPMSALGKILSDYMDPEVPNPHTEAAMSWQGDRDRLVGELEFHGLRYTGGGKITNERRPKRFIAEQLYYLVWYIDPLRLCLHPEPVVFIGCDTEAFPRTPDSDVWYFQDADSYFQTDEPEMRRRREGNRSKSGNFTRLSRSDLFQAVDARGLAYRLLECEERRVRAQKRGSQNLGFSRGLIYYRIHYRDSAKLLLDIESLAFLGPVGAPTDHQQVLQFEALQIDPEEGEENQTGYASSGSNALGTTAKLVAVEARQAAAVLDCRALATECKKVFRRQARLV